MQTKNDDAEPGINGTKRPCQFLIRHVYSNVCTKKAFPGCCSIESLLHCLNTADGLDAVIIACDFPVCYSLVKNPSDKKVNFKLKQRPVLVMLRCNVLTVLQWRLGCFFFLLGTLLT